MDRYRRRLLASSLAAIPLALAGARAHGAGRDAEDLAPVPGRHRRPRATSATASAGVRRRHRETQQRRAQGAVYPGSSLMKNNSQFSALRKGALDSSSFRCRTPAAKCPRPTSA